MSKIAKINSSGGFLGLVNPSSVVVDGITHPANIFELWSDAELNTIGFARFTEIPVSEGQLSTNIADAFVDGKIVRTHTSIPDPDHLERSRGVVRQQIKNWAKSIRAASISYSLDGGATSFAIQTDLNSRTNMIGATLKLNERGNPNAVQNWRTLDNTTVGFTMGEFKEMVLAVLDHVEATHTTQASLERLVKDADTIATLNEIDITVGWPPTYLGALG